MQTSASVNRGTKIACLGQGVFSTFFQINLRNGVALIDTFSSIAAHLCSVVLSSLKHEKKELFASLIVELVCDFAPQQGHTNIKDGGFNAPPPPPTGTLVAITSASINTKNRRKGYVMEVAGGMKLMGYAEERMQ